MSPRSINVNTGLRVQREDTDVRQVFLRNRRKARIGNMKNLRNGVDYVVLEDVNTVTAKRYE